MHHCWPVFHSRPLLVHNGWMGRPQPYLFVPICLSYLSHQKKPPRSLSTPRWLGVFEIYGFRLYEVTRLGWPVEYRSNHHHGDGTSNSANLWHISRNCHFLQSHKRRSELLALVKLCRFPMPFVGVKFPRLLLSFKKWVTSILFDLFKGLCLIISIVIWNYCSKPLCHISYDSRGGEDNFFRYQWFYWTSIHYVVTLFSIKMLESFRVEVGVG